MDRRQGAAITDTPTPAEAEEHAKLCEKATAGEWEVWDSCSWRRIGIKHTMQTVVEPYNQRSDGHPDLKATRDDLEFIAAARTHWPRYIRALQEATTAQQRLREALEWINNRMLDRYDDSPSEPDEAETGAEKEFVMIWQDVLIHIRQALARSAKPCCVVCDTDAACEYPGGRPKHCPRNIGAEP